MSAYILFFIMSNLCIQSKSKDSGTGQNACIVQRASSKHTYHVTI